MNKTEHYDLNQWQLHDRVMMQDFNADNAKIDAALKAEADARAAADATLTGKVAKCGNCRMELLTYTGTGTYGSSNPTRITFSARPTVFFVIGGQAFLTGRGGVSYSELMVYTASNTTSFTSISTNWSGNTAALSSDIGAHIQLNTRSAAYWVLALYKMD